MEERKMLFKFEKKYWNQWVSFLNKCWANNDGSCDTYDYDINEERMRNATYDQLKDYLLLVIVDGEIIGSFYREEVLGFNCFSFGCCQKGKEKECLSYLKEAYPNSLMSSSYNYDELMAQKELGYRVVNAKSKYGGEYGGQLPVTAGDVDAYVRKVDELVFPELTGELEFSVMSGDELSDFVGDGVVLYNWNSPCWEHKIAGFNYLSFENMHHSERDIKFLVAHIGHTMVGVIHFGVWYPGSQEISFIDVAKPYRKMGVATKMIKELNNHLIPNVPLHLTQESEMGKACHISEIFKKHITVVPVKSHMEVYGY
jgi:hypothetical protein